MEIRRAHTPKEKAAAFKIREIVFIEEQHVPVEIEMDAFDDTAIHFVGYVHEAPVAASRLRLFDEYGKLERIAVLKEARGQSYGKQVIEAMERVIAEHGIPQAKLNAQTHAEQFYKHLGYKTVSEPFIDAGIPHVTMIKQL
ncbi:GNAT family N-acetyltransferase [Lentibacillus saliphilus]|uniref:GNAT family N-acetyltransferase n=1 Tax=Lentibacillus saliphilus TaxID=2737028 RepID=UPI001C2F7A9C|nr:GNAT family N-acetyltransferase [Lentibacillus saliphilus]